jgi:hypothetical protein
LLKQIPLGYQQATILSPLFNKGLAHINLNRSEEAITFFDRKSEIDPENPKAFDDKGYTV